MEDNWVLRKVKVEGFDALSMVNTGYLDFEKKENFPFLLSVELELIDTVNDMPTGEENVCLTDIEEDLLKIFESTQEVHYIGHVTRKGWRDILCYVGSKNLDGEAIGAYCDNISANRDISIEINEDPQWNMVIGLLK